MSYNGHWMIELAWSMISRESGYCTFTATIVPLYLSLALCTCNEQFYECHCVCILGEIVSFEERHLKQHAAMVMHKELDELAEGIRPRPLYD